MQQGTGAGHRTPCMQQGRAGLGKARTPCMQQGSRAGHLTRALCCVTQGSRRQGASQGTYQHGHGGTSVLININVVPASAHQHAQELQHGPTHGRAADAAVAGAPAASFSPAVHTPSAYLGRTGLRGHGDAEREAEREAENAIPSQLVKACSISRVAGLDTLAQSLVSREDRTQAEAHGGPPCKRSSQGSLLAPHLHGGPPSKCDSQESLMSNSRGSFGRVHPAPPMSASSNTSRGTLRPSNTGSITSATDAVLEILGGGGTAPATPSPPLGLEREYGAMTMGEGEGQDRPSRLHRYTSPGIVHAHGVMPSRTSTGINSPLPLPLPPGSCISDDGRQAGWAEGQLEGQLTRCSEDLVTPSTAAEPQLTQVHLGFTKGLTKPP